MVSDFWELLACFMLHMAESVWRKDRTALIIHPKHDGEKEAVEKSKSSDKQGSLLSADAGFAQTGNDQQLSHPWKEQVLLAARGAKTVKFLRPEVGFKVSDLEHLANSRVPSFRRPVSTSTPHGLNTEVVNILEPSAFGTRSLGVSAIVEHIDQNLPEARCYTWGYLSGRITKM